MYDVNKRRNQGWGHGEGEEIYEDSSHSGHTFFINCSKKVSLFKIKYFTAPKNTTNKFERQNTDWGKYLQPIPQLENIFFNTSRTLMNQKGKT